MVAKVISVANMKGGVGKTTIAVALAHEFVKSFDGQKSARVLLVDLDAQANASFSLCGDAALTGLIEQGKTIDAFLEDSIVLNMKRELKDFIYSPAPTNPSQGGLFVIPSSPELRIVEREMICFLSRRKRGLLEVERVITELFSAQLQELKASFDVIVFDCAPGISALTEAALRSSDIIIVPTIPDFISNLGLEAFCKTVLISNREGTDLQKTPWVVANMVKTSMHHQAMLQEMRAEATADDGGFKMFAIEIPDMPWVEEATTSVSGAGARAFAADASGSFSKLAAEVMEVTHAAAH